MGEMLPTARTPTKAEVGLQLHDAQIAPKRVRWTECTIDNEHLGRRSSKAMCVYPKPRAFDESSEEEDVDGEYDDVEDDCSYNGLQQLKDAMSFKRQRRAYPTCSNAATNITIREGIHSGLRACA